MQPSLFIQAEYPWHHVTVGNVKWLTMVDITVPNIWNATQDEIVMSTVTSMNNDTLRAQYYGSLPVVGLAVLGKNT